MPNIVTDLISWRRPLKKCFKRADFTDLNMLQGTFNWV